MKSTLFESLMIADREKIHTQFIAWLLDPHSEVLKEEDRKKIISKIWIDEIQEITKIISVETEIENMDLLVKTETTLYVLENKLKSSEFDEQTNKYRIAAKKYINDNNYKSKFSLLTLIKEEALSDVWVNVTYENLLDSLRDIVKEFCMDPKNKNQMFICEYIHTLKNLLTVYNKFIMYPKEYNNVFHDASKKKNEKYIYDCRFPLYCPELPELQY